MSLPSLPVRLDADDLAIETAGIEKRYGSGTRALAGLDLQVPAGSVYVLAGPNGAGKSTAMKILLDLVRADRGTARVCGLETTARPALVRAHIGYVPEVVEAAYAWVSGAPRRLLPRVGLEIRRRALPAPGRSPARAGEGPVEGRAAPAGAGD